MARVLNLLSERDRKLFTEEMFSLYNVTAQRASEIARKVVDDFLDQLNLHSVQNTFNQLTADVTTSTGSIRGHPYIKYTIVISHPVFDWLDEGHTRKKLDAHDYGLKAFPLVLARSKNYGNRPSTSPNSLKISSPKVVQGTIYRRFIRRPTAPRNFVPLLEKRIEDALAKEGIDIDVKVVSR